MNESSYSLLLPFVYIVNSVAGAVLVSEYETGKVGEVITFIGPISSGGR